MEANHRLGKFFRSAPQAFLRLSPVRRVHVVAGIAASAVILYLLFAPKPWQVAWSGLSKDFLDYCILYYSWWGGLFALGVIAILSITARWWLRPLPAGNLAAREASCSVMARATPVWFWPCVGAAVLLTGVMGAQRLNFSLWDDEHYTARRFVQGNYRPADDGTVSFRERKVGSTFHDYRMPNNHILHNLLARGPVALGKLFRDPTGPAISEVALRLPAFLFGMASVVALALMMKELGLARAGVFAAFLLALHPWHIRYASEARGYSMVLFFLPLLIVFWVRALRTGLWRWWIALAATQFALLYTYPAVIYPVAALNLATLIFLLARYPLDLAPAIPLGRWLVAGACAAAAFIWLFLPCVPQMQSYLAQGMASGVMGRGWWLDFGSHLFAGVTWFRSGDPASPQPELYAMRLAQPALYTVVLGLASLLGLVGLARWFSRGWLPAVVALIFFLPAGLAWLMAVRSETHLYVWYLIYVLPGLVAVLATGFDALSLPWRNHRWSALVPALVLVAFLIGYLTLVQEAPRWLLTKSIQPLREAALVARGTIAPNYEGHEKVVTTAFLNPLFLYDPHRIVVEDAAELLALARRCDEEGRELYVHVGMPKEAAQKFPEIFRLLSSSEVFEVVAYLPGYDPTLDRLVARYLPGTLAD